MLGNGDLGLLRKFEKNSLKLYIFKQDSKRVNILVWFEIFPFQLDFSQFKNFQNLLYCKIYLLCLHLLYDIIFHEMNFVSYRFKLCTSENLWLPLVIYSWEDIQETSFLWKEKLFGEKMKWSTNSFECDCMSQLKFLPKYLQTHWFKSLDSANLRRS